MGEVKELELYQPDIMKHPGLMKGHISFLGEVLLGHRRYGTQGRNNANSVIPLLKGIPSAVALAGNFNLVNTDELFALINIDPGEFQKQSDLAAMMEVIHHFQVQADEAAPGNLDLVSLLRKAVSLFDGGFTVGGMMGNGDGFVFRDAHGIRPAYYYLNDDVVVAASERAAIRTVFNVGENEGMELMPGMGLIVKADGKVSVEKITEPRTPGLQLRADLFFPGAAMRRSNGKG